MEKREEESLKYIYMNDVEYRSAEKRKKELARRKEEKMKGRGG